MSVSLKKWPEDRKKLRDFLKGIKEEKGCPLKNLTDLSLCCPLESTAPGCDKSWWECTFIKPYLPRRK